MRVGICPRLILNLRLIPIRSRATARALLSADNGGGINIRQGNGLNYGRLRQVPSGTYLPYVATAANGWIAVVTGSAVGWVSGEFARVV